MAPNQVARSLAPPTGRPVKHFGVHRRFAENINGKAVTTIVAFTSGDNQNLRKLSRHHFDPNGCPERFLDGIQTLVSFKGFQQCYLFIVLCETKSSASTSPWTTQSRHDDSEQEDRAL
jgi:hypothetical protein